jgi:Ferritin-like domain
VTTTEAGPEVSRGGALDELARDDSSRKKFLKIMGGASGAAALSTLIAACGGDSSSGSSSSSSSMSSSSSSSSSMASNKGDLEIVNYALTLEYLEASFYEKVAKSGLFKGAELETIKKFGAQEAAHVQALKATASQLGTPAPKPMTKFPLNDKMSVLKLAAQVENLGAAAYLGQAPRIKSKKILAAALSIHAVEARHAAALNTLLGKSPTPDGAFAKPASMAQVLPVAKKFIVA